MNRSDFRCLMPLRVRWAEVDLQKIVFNAHYLMYLDTAMAHYWRELAVPYNQAMHRLGGDIFVKKSGLEFFASAEYDDSLQIGLKCERIGKSSMQFVGGIFRGDELLVSGEILYVYADPVLKQSRPVPDALRQLFTDYEAAKPITRMLVGSWADIAPYAKPLRFEVFVGEQGVPADIEIDDFDDTAIHAVLLNQLDMPIATARLLQPAPKVAQIGRMAVSRPLRGMGYGNAVLRALIDEANSREDDKVILHAQTSAWGFYAKAGFSPVGLAFQEAGIEHIEMQKHLWAQA